MKWCLRCNNQFIGTSAFCDNCQSSLLNRSQLKETLSQLGPALTPSAAYAQVADAGASLPNVPLRSDVGWETVPISDPGSAIIKRSPQHAWEETVPDPPMHGAKGESIAQPVYRNSALRLGRWRKVFLALLILAVVGIMIDSVLVVLTFRRHAHDASGLDVTPIMLLSNNVVNRGDSVTIHLLHCQPLSQIILIRDVQDPLYTDVARQPVHISSDGEAVVQMQIDAGWKLGSHRLKAEDVKTHYVIDSPLYVSGSGPVQGAHLQVSQTSVDMGAEDQWKGNSTSLELSNTGSGMVSWLASSDQSWLRLTPMQGRLSKPQNVFLSVTREHLVPGQYQGAITIASNAGASLVVRVKMSVLPRTVSAITVLGLAPNSLAFGATDGGADPGEQVVMIKNPGASPLSWSLNKNVTIGSGQDMPNDIDWLSVEPTSGVISAGASASLRVLVHSQPLLEGTYMRMLSLATEQGGSANAQSLLVSLNVGRHCGVVADTADIALNMAVGQSTQPHQELNLNATAECAGTFPWNTYSLANWLFVASDKGQLAAKAHETVAMEVNARRLQAGPYSALLVFTTTRRTDIVLVQLTVQPAEQGGLAQTVPTPGATSEPNKNVTLQTTPTRLAFSATQGQTSLPGQSVSIESVEHMAFSWHASFDTDWLTLTPQKGSVAAGQSGQMVVSGNAAGLEAGNYTAHISIVPQDATGKQNGKVRVLTVTFSIAAQCVFQVSPAQLFFSASLLQPSPPAQSITLKGGANCAYPVTWTAAVVEPASRSWLSVSVTNGTENGDGTTITVSINRKEMVFGNYTGHITITAFDNNGAPMQGGAQTVTVTLNVFG